MKFDAQKEIPLFLVLFTPLVYLYLVWSKIPDQVPIHYNLEANADIFMSTIFFVGFIIALLFVGYFLVTLVNLVFDRKKEYKKMGNKMYHFRFVLAFEMAALSCFFIYMIVSENPMLILLL